MNYRSLTAGSALALAACAGMPGVEMGSPGAKTVATGSAAGATSANANGQLERCDQSLGTLAVIEDQGAPWYSQLRNEYKLQSTVPLIRLLVQQSNCFVVIERGDRGMNAMSRERQLESSGEMRAGSNFGRGQMVSADYSLNPSISFSQSDAGGVGAALGVSGGATPASRDLPRSR
ncbi:MAG: hypothetical protein H0T52_02380 [Lautropia sp.]|nr:hypothetical protein [Lautropia sp.]